MSPGKTQTWTRLIWYGLSPENTKPFKAKVAASGLAGWLLVGYGLLPTRSTITSWALSSGAALALMSISSRAFCSPIAYCGADLVSFTRTLTPVTGLPWLLHDPKFSTTSYPEALSISAICEAKLAASEFVAVLSIITRPLGSSAATVLKCSLFHGESCRHASTALSFSVSRCAPSASFLAVSARRFKFAFIAFARICAWWVPIHSTASPKTSTIQQIAEAYSYRFSYFLKWSFQNNFAQISAPSPTTPTITAINPHSATHSQNSSADESKRSMDDFYKRSVRRSCRFFVAMTIYVLFVAINFYLDHRVVKGPKKS